MALWWKYLISVRIISRKLNLCYLKITQSYSNGRKSSNLVKELICHLITGYLGPLPSYFSLSRWGKFFTLISPKMHSCLTFKSKKYHMIMTIHLSISSKWLSVDFWCILYFHCHSFQLLEAVVTCQWLNYWTQILTFSVKK